MRSLCLALVLMLSSVAFGQQYRIIEYDNANSEIFSVKDDGDVSIVETLILFGGPDLTALSTGVGDNDKLVTQGYVDDNSSLPGGTDTLLQYNNGGAFGGMAGVTWDDTANELTLTAQAADDTPLQIVAAATPSASLFEITSNGGTPGDVFIVANDGDVGIGTNDPGANGIKLYRASGEASFRVESDTDDARLRFDAGTNFNAYIHFLESGSLRHSIFTDGDAANDPLYFYDYGSNGIVLGINNGNLDVTDADLIFTEKAAVSSTPAAGFGYLWVEDTDPSTLVFTDDAGTDFTLGVPPGSNTYVPYNNSGVWGTDADFYFLSIIDTLYVPKIIASGAVNVGSLVSSGAASWTSGSAQVLTLSQWIDVTGDIIMTEKADHDSTPGAGHGYLWTKSTDPSTLVFTDDGGTDWTLNGPGASSDTEFLYNNGGVIDGAASATYDDSDGSVLFQNSADSTTALEVKDIAGNSVFNVDTTNGRVGIGLGDPDQILHMLSNDGSAYLKIHDSRSTAGDSAGIMLGTMPNSGALVSKTLIAHVETTSWGRGDLVFASNTDSDRTEVTLSDEVARLTYSGRLGINEPLPTELLDVSDGTTNVTIDGRRLEFKNTNDNIFIGTNAGLNTDITEAGVNIYVGASAGTNGTTGAFYNVAIGHTSLQTNLVGDRNTAVGRSTLKEATGQNNSAYGDAALSNLGVGDNNMAIGRNAGIYLTVGSDNMLVGQGAGSGVTGVSAYSQAVALGSGALGGLTSGNYNIGIGYVCADNISSGSSNLIIGNSLDAQSATASNQMSIGNLLFSEGVDGTGTTISSGKLGVKTTKPDSTLELNDSAGASLRLTYDDSDGGADNKADLATDANGGLDITTDDSDGTAGDIDMVIDGVLNITGTASADHTITSGNLHLDGAGSTYVKIDRGNATASDAAIWYQMAGASTWLAGTTINGGTSGDESYRIVDADAGPTYTSRFSIADSGAITLGDDQSSGQVVVSNGFVLRSTTAGITAATPGGQGDGALTTEFNEVSTVGTALDAVTLPAAEAGKVVEIINNGSNTLEIWPASGDNLGSGVDNETTLNASGNVRYVAYDSTNWEKN